MAKTETPERKKAAAKRLDPHSAGSSLPDLWPTGAADDDDPFSREVEIRQKGRVVHVTRPKVARKVRVTQIHVSGGIVAAKPRVGESNKENYNHETPSPEAAAVEQPFRVTEKTETIQAAAELLSSVYPRKAVDAALAELAANAARETTARAKGEPPVAEVSPRVRALFGDVPAPRTRAHKRRNLPDEVVNDPDVIEAAKVIVNAHRYTATNALEPDDAEKLRTARTIVRRQERRNKLAGPHPR